MQYAKDLSGTGHTGFSNPRLFLALLVVALVLRFAIFGDPNLHADENFYQAVGISMHQGAIPYIDVWDRKPWGLFFLYYLIAFISHEPLAYQIIATLFATATAGVIGLLASHWSRPRGSIFAGIAYLLWLNVMQGFGGQSPVFYNLFIANAALLVFRASDDLRCGRAPLTIPLAMLLGGLAITVKQTSIFEAAFFGLYASILLLRSPLPRGRACLHILAWASIGATPMLAISIWYVLHGYWPIYWQAMALSSADRPMFLFAGTMRLLVMFTLLAPLLIVATMSLATWKGEGRRFLGLWLVAALFGLLSVPNFYMHYSLPLLAPLCIATGAFLSRPVGGPIGMLCLGAYAIHITDTFEFDRPRRSKAAFEKLVSVIHAHDDGSPLFLVDAPPQLYPMTGHAFPTPLVFPTHLGAKDEKDLSHLSTLNETQRVLALQPGIVVTPDKPREGPPNMEVLNVVNAYVTAHCRQVANIETPDYLTSATMTVWADCRRGNPSSH